jgi:predicted ester cyclase
MMENMRTNKEVVDEWQRIIDSKVFDDLEKVESADVVNINSGGTVNGIPQHKQMLNAFAIAFPDYLHDNFNFVEQGEWVAMQGIFSGTHSGPLTIAGKTLAPTNNKISFGYGGFIRVSDRKVVENYLYYDSKTFLEQLGL